MKELENINKQLSITEKKYKTLAEQIPAITYIADMDEAGSVRYVSPQIEQILGFSPEEWLADPALWSKQLHPDDRERVLAEYKSSYEKCQPFRSEYRCLTYDGRVVWCHNNAVLVKDDAGKPLFYQGIVSDITEYKRIAEEIHLFRIVTLAVSQARNLHDVLVTVMQKICDHTSWVYGETWKPNHDDTLLVRDCACFCSIDGFEKFPVSEEFTFSRGVGLPGLVWTIKHPMWAHDITSDPNYLHNPLVRELGLKTGIAFPIVVDNEVVNIIVFYHVKIEKKNEQLVSLISNVLLQIGSIIKRIQAEETLRKSEASLANAQRIAHLGSWKWNVGGNEIWWSEETYRVFGVESGEFVPAFEKFLNAIHPDDREFVQESIQKAVNDGKPYNIEFRIVRPDGSERVLRSQGEVVYNDIGKAIQMNGTAQDITERKRAEELLRESEGKLRSILDNATAVIYIKDIQGRYTFINKQFEKLFHIKREEIKGKTPYDCFPDKIAASHLENDQKVFETKVPMQFDEIATHDDGVVHSFISIKFPLFDAKGVIYAVCGISTDITERKRIEMELQRSEERFRQIAENIREVFWSISPANNEIVYVSPAYEEIWGRTCESLYKNPIDWINAVHPDDHRRIEAAFLDISKQVKFNEEYRIIRPDGSIRCIHDRAFPVIDKSGSICRIVGIAEDITVRKKLEGEKEKLKEQLYISQNLASIGKLAGGVAHNFNNLLTVIMGYASLIQTELKKNDPLREYAARIMKSSQNAANLTQGLLAFSRKQPISLKPVNINDVIKESESFLSKLIREDIAFTILLTKEDTYVMADAGQIYEILMHLTSNACDAMSKGGCLTIRTDVMKMDDAFIKSHGYGRIEKYVHLFVSDTGIGIDEKTKLRIFEPFFTTKEVGKGTGLGLASVYGIVKQHGGYINVDSVPGEGSVFNVYLPAIELKIESAEEEAVPAVFPEGGTETILLAADELEVKEIIKTVFEDYGYKVIEAADGEDAMEKFTKNKDTIQLLVFDLMMPKKNGKEAYEAIKKMRPDMKALFITGYDDDAINKIDIHKERFNYILKPVSPHELLGKVREVLGKS